MGRGKKTKSRFPTAPIVVLIDAENPSLNPKVSTEASSPIHELQTLNSANLPVESSPLGHSEQNQQSESVSPLLPDITFKDPVVAGTVAAACISYANSAVLAETPAPTSIWKSDQPRASSYEKPSDCNFTFMAQKQDTQSSLANIRVTGMTCASCVGAIERALVSHPSIQSASVNLMTNSADVVFDPLGVDAEDICDVVESIGFDAEIIHVVSGAKSSSAPGSTLVENHTVSSKNVIHSEEDLKIDSALPSKNKHSSRLAFQELGLNENDKTVISFVPSGMRCQACVRKLTAALENIPGVSSSRISLNAASAVVCQRAVPSQVIETTVRQCGFELTSLSMHTQNNGFSDEKNGIIQQNNKLETAPKKIPVITEVNSGQPIAYEKSDSPPESCAVLILHCSPQINHSLSLNNDDDETLITREWKKWISNSRAILGVKSITRVKNSDFVRIMYDPFIIGARSLLDKLSLKNQHTMVTMNLVLSDEETLNKSRGRDSASLARREIINLIIGAIPVLLTTFLMFTPYPPEFLMRPAYPFVANLPWHSLIMFFLSLPAMLWLGAPLHAHAWASVKSRIVIIPHLISRLIFRVLGYGDGFHDVGYRTYPMGMDCLISIASTVAFFYSSLSLAVFASNPNPTLTNGSFETMPAEFFDTPAVLIWVVLLGRCLEKKAKRQTQAALSSLAALKPVSAKRIVGLGSMVKTPAQLLEVGDIIQLDEGETSPVDGIVQSNQNMDGTISMDESILTGESKPVEKNPGDLVRSGATLTAGSSPLRLRVSVIGSGSTLGRILSAVETAQNDKGSSQRLADKLAEVFAPVALFLATLTVIIWGLALKFDIIPKKNLPQNGEGDFWSNAMFCLRFGVAVLSIACPCSLGLATPTAVMAATGAAARCGIFVKGGSAFETGARITHIIFDKTGTITTGQPSIISASVCPVVASLSDMPPDLPIPKPPVEHGSRDSVSLPLKGQWQVAMHQILQILRSVPPTGPRPHHKHNYQKTKDAQQIQVSAIHAENNRQRGNNSVSVPVTAISSSTAFVRFVSHTFSSLSRLFSSQVNQLPQDGAYRQINEDDENDTCCERAVREAANRASKCCPPLEDPSLGPSPNCPLKGSPANSEFAAGKVHMLGVNEMRTVRARKSACCEHDSSVSTLICVQQPTSEDENGAKVCCAAVAEPSLHVCPPPTYEPASPPLFNSAAKKLIDCSRALWWFMGAVEVPSSHPIGTTITRYVDSLEDVPERCSLNHWRILRGGRGVSGSIKASTLRKMFNLSSSQGINTNNLNFNDDTCINEAAVQVTVAPLALIEPTQTLTSAPLNLTASLPLVSATVRCSGTCGCSGICGCSLKGGDCGCLVLVESPHAQSAAILDDPIAALAASSAQKDYHAKDLKNWAAQQQSIGATVVLLIATDVPSLLEEGSGAILGACALRDPPVTSARACVEFLMDHQEMDVWMCTGDAAAAARSVASEVGLKADRVISEALPSTKVNLVHRLKISGNLFLSNSDSYHLLEEGQTRSDSETNTVVAMVGDGINDAPALATADCGIAIGGGATIAMNAADVVISGSDISGVCNFIMLSRATVRTVRRNFIWACLFNGFGIPLAAGVFFIPFGVVIPPAIAGLLMALSSIIVVLSSLALTYFKPLTAEQWIAYSSK